MFCVWTVCVWCLTILGSFIILFGEGRIVLAGWGILGGLVAGSMVRVWMAI